MWCARSATAPLSRRPEESSHARPGEKGAVLLLRVRESGRMAIPLSMVARLEEFPRERLSNRAAARSCSTAGRSCRSSIFAARMDHGAGRRRCPLQVVVYSEQGRSVGLVVDRILDIVEESLPKSMQAASHGVIGSAVIAGKVTDLLDVHGVIRAADPDSSNDASAA